MLDEVAEKAWKRTHVPWDPYSVRRLLVNLSKVSSTFPPSLFCRTLCVDRNPVALGGCADIFKATVNNRPVALKRLRVFQRSSSRNVEVTYNAICREALVWHGLRHKYILPFLGVDPDTFRPFCCIVSLWMQHGNISDCVYQLLSAGKVAPLERWFVEISLGLKYLHLQKVVHGDLRGANILIDNDFRVQLADFGLAQFADASSASAGSQGGGAVRWLAPELLRGSRSNYASDVYAFGCVWLEVYTHYPPFKHLRHDFQMIAKVLEGAIPEWPSVNPDFSGQLCLDDWRFVQKCWASRPSSRPDISSLVASCILSAQYFIQESDDVFLSSKLPSNPPEAGDMDGVLVSEPRELVSSSSPTSISLLSHLKQDETFTNPFDLDDENVSPSSLPSDIAWMMPNWPFINNTSMEDTPYERLSFQEETMPGGSSSAYSTLHDSPSIFSSSTMGSRSSDSSKRQPEITPVSNPRIKHHNLDAIPERFEDLSD
ncbi:unnamed protein product [Somion occarium]|uniref:Protein kinase domain-containing protein n=1 Tax=Somion occarium TaxID=3059160 RepID=A0ABP1DXL7_9APHY